MGPGMGSACSGGFNMAPLAAGGMAPSARSVGNLATAAHPLSGEDLPCLAPFPQPTLCPTSSTAILATKRSAST